MKLIIGLGNIGKEYENTFHNTGFAAIDAIGAKIGALPKKNECSSLTASAKIGAERVVLAKPATYMNLSGDAVKSLVVKYKADYSDVVIIYDDIDLPRFKVRVRESGSAGTHNGMRDVVSKCGTADIKRVRIGIGRNGGELKDFVLSSVSKADREEFAKVFAKVADAVCEYAEDGDFAKFARTLNA